MPKKNVIIVSRLICLSGKKREKYFYPVFQVFLSFHYQ